MNSHKDILLCIFIAIFSLIYMYLRLSHYPLESDELQHLHIIYSRTKGLLEYKDIFDNHVPLFHIILSSLIKFIAIKPSFDFAIQVRFLIFILFFLPQLVVIYLFLRKGLEFSFSKLCLVICLFSLLVPNSDIAIRPAPLYTLLFLTSIYVISFFDLKKRDTAFILGLINGINATVSLKSLILFLPPQLVTIFIMNKIFNIKTNFKRFFGYFFLGFSIFPIIISAYLMKLDSFKSMIYYTTEYNMISLNEENYLKRVTIAIGIITFYFYFLRKYRQKLQKPIFSFLSITLLTLSILIVYPERQSQTTMPVRVLIYLSILMSLTYLFSKIRKKYIKDMAQLIIFIVVFTYKIFHPNLLIDQNKQYKENLAVLLNLAEKNDLIMDAKGESIFWRRPYYYVLEKFTITRLKLGLLREQIIPKLVKSKTHIVFLFDGEKRFSKKVISFIKENYLPVSKWIYVSGKKISKKFKVNIAGNYIIINSDGKTIKGILDGKTYTGGSIYLSKGTHTFIPEKKEKNIYIYWYKALKKGVLPYGIKK